ncbi:unnamed protein product [Cuscuta europaea]|uniref:Uncharacterized protein n=1 Tax=Cuscuta europaea TaxID=41803 RepID=A0A9P0Z720_CUSEU|nr:unnamed protein product [Cuscuta europaea]
MLGGHRRPPHESPSTWIVGDRLWRSQEQHHRATTRTQLCFELGASTPLQILVRTGNSRRWKYVSFDSIQIFQTHELFSHSGLLVYDFKGDESWQVCDDCVYNNS